jgi:hypothetical protein
LARASTKSPHPEPLRVSDLSRKRERQQLRF